MGCVYTDGRWLLDLPEWVGVEPCEVLVHETDLEGTKDQQLRAALESVQQLQIQPSRYVAEGSLTFVRGAERSGLLRRRRNG